MVLYLFQILLWFTYGVLHSVLAANRVKQFFRQKMGVGYRYYRLIYNLLAVVFLAGLIFYQWMLPVQSLWAFDWRIDIIGNLLKYGGLLIVLIGVSGYNF